jgi:PAS domain S-box-containing protein
MNASGEFRAGWPPEEEFYRSILESLGQGVIITDTESRIMYANAAMEEMTGHARREMIGRISYELLSPPANWPTMRRRLAERLSGRTEEYEHELVRRDGRWSWVSVKATPLRDATGGIAGTIGVLTSIDREMNLELRNEYLLEELRSEGRFGEIVGRSAALAKVLEQIDVVAPTETGVLVLGESGTGKELVARAIHDASGRREKPLVRVNCAAIPRELFESEFFGHVKGSFTGAIRDRVGRFELADGGTLFLDEVSEIPVDLQAKLLRVIQEGQMERIGEERTRAVDVRLISATNRDLGAEIRAGRFRQDLYYRLSVFTIEVPPLRERVEDIGILASRCVELSAKRLGVTPPTLTRAHIRALERYDWPGNVRELQNVIERAVILARRGPFRVDLPSDAPPMPSSKAATAPVEATGSLAELKDREREMIESALKRARGKIYGADGAAALLGLRPTTLASKLIRLGIDRKAFGA